MDDAIIFIYGLAFFTLGIVAWANRARASTDDPIVRARPFLVLFAVIHGIAEWVELPIFSFPLGAGAAGALLMHSASFMFLGLFGLAVLVPGRRMRPLFLIPPVAFIAWLTFSYVPGLFGDGLRNASIIGRLFLSFPSALVSSVALFRKSRLVPPIAPPAIKRGINGLALTFALYAVFSGLIVDSALFFAYTGFRIEIARSACAVVSAILYGFVNHLLEWEAQNQQREADSRASSAEERRSLADELHDTVIQEMFAVGLEIETAGRRSKDPEARSAFLHAKARLNKIIGEIRNFLSDSAAEIPDLDEFGKLVEKPLDEARALPDVTAEFELVPDGLQYARLTPRELFHLLRIVQEAVRNSVRHSCLLSVKVRLFPVSRGAVLEIVDRCRPGIPGRDAEDLDSSGRSGYGLVSMEHRARSIGAEMTWTRSEEGSRLRIDIPWKRSDA
ncbi:MAG: hypothetical protein A2Z99_06510 [Treponema sp. GWB1_62_6]|nr:MAG: hypothetical protein A2Y36_02685 [Treponema sp. GWA1_62_8]OHE68250.1 MAG: hypothetical protein A2413_01410 [Treponema sp. RIFOXYC1_FULL_61_9]OHE69526.1 MAG: hypothetical protein A2001_18770 [Treponema sp. GWC1_61_84]OHE69548.1 MAG: hypothetical protein A2Z99_06510 [Treponema sp. GWB1_62_6]HCM25868.1 hypothetical protein [Treponema sp.]